MEGEGGGEEGGGRSGRDMGVFKRSIECISPHLRSDSTNSAIEWRYFIYNPSLLLKERREEDDNKQHRRSVSI